MDSHRFPVDKIKFLCYKRPNNKQKGTVMKIVSPSVQILTPLDGEQILRHIENCGRTCYQSYENKNEESHKKMIAMLIKSGHESVLEHFSISVKILTNVSCYKDITRHRAGTAFSIESTRFCSYNKDKFGNELKFLKPVNIQEGTDEYTVWQNCMQNIEDSYKEMANLGCKPDQLRMILPHSIAAEVCMTANLRAWRHIFKMRCAKAAHPDVQVVMKMVLKEFHDKIPVVFDDLYNEFLGK